MSTLSLYIDSTESMTMAVVSHALESNYGLRLTHCAMTSYVTAIDTAHRLDELVEPCSVVLSALTTASDCMWPANYMRPRLLIISCV